MDNPHVRPRFDWPVVALLAVSMAAWTLSWLLVPARGAPVPVAKVKPAKPAPALVGRWAMTWHNSTGSADFNADGSYFCNWNGQSWYGHWKHDPKAGTLTVVEWQAEGLTSITWTATLTGPRAGTLSGVGKFVLE